MNEALGMVGMTGFEPATTRPPGVYATGLRYIPCLVWEKPVGHTGFEPVTSALSRQRSKPTELMTLFASLSKRVQM